MLKKPFLLIALSIGLSTELVLTNLVVLAKPTSRTPSTTRVTKPGNTRQTGNTRKTPRRSVLGFKVPGIRASRNREGGAQRGEACKQAEDLKALLPPRPKDLSPKKAPIEPTISSHPTFLVQVPQSVAKHAEFVLLKDDGSEEILVKEKIDISSSTGLVAYTLPKSFKGLESGQKYLWRFSLLCGVTDRSGNPKVSSGIEKIEPTPTVAQKLAAATDDFDRLAIYAENGFWQETVKTLVDLRAANPNDQDLTESWNNIFKSVGLQALAQQPVFQLTGVPSDQVN